MDSYLSHLSDQTYRLLTRANEEARRLDDEYVGTQQVLLAFLDDERSGLAAVLDRLGVQVDEVRREVEKLFPAARSLLRVGVLPHTPRVRRVIEEAIAESNRLPFGLASYAFTTSIKTLHLLSRRLEVGMLWVNQPAAPVAELPFGGVKDSGYGSEGGPEALDDYLNTRTVVVANV